MFETVTIPAAQVTTDDEIVIAWFRYRVTDVETCPSGVRVLTIDTGYSQALAPGDLVRVVRRSRRLPAREVTVRMSPREGHGTSYVWSRTFNGVPFWFTFVVMPNGERRYWVTRYNGYGDDGTPEGRAIGRKFGCAWSPVHNITVKAG